MPWKELSIMSEREEFVRLAEQEAESVAGLCRRFGISRQTGYKWLGRHRAGAGLHDRSRRPMHSPARSDEQIEQLVLGVRGEHPAWGGRKIRAWLLARGHEGVPSPSTITEILRRHGLISPEASQAATPPRRFEYERPNDLWQMDFKGPVTMRRGTCNALTILDDHSRYSIGLFSCAHQNRKDVQERLTFVFQRYGLPWRILADNGTPWGGERTRRWTLLKVWLLKLGVPVIHGRPAHPQTQGKDERFHRTLSEELLRRADLRNHADTQAQFDAWRTMYNFERPHEALGLAPPASRYRPSKRAFPERVVPLEPCDTDTPRRVTEGGRIRWKRRRWYLGAAWDQEVVGLREGPGGVEVRYGPYLIGVTDATAGTVRLIPVGRCAPSLHQPQ